ncbi:hypothetical protein VMCG_00824 [Cytospora schulzeri]|uniref:O-methyltransferase domain-containing protein n=1 Tax=Cytospora schulzeri TaxID=448051 RepID=A0A423X919_9PEZI|nr:hypothetical protein VMCG_00824 [Valsa malicola]
MYHATSALRDLTRRSRRLIPAGKPCFPRVPVLRSTYRGLSSATTTREPEPHPIDRMATRASEESANIPCPKHSIVPPKEKIQLTGPEETMIPMVFFRALDAKKDRPILGDPYSQKILDRCDIDFSAGHFIRNDRFIEYVMNRCKQLDTWCQEFLDSHENEPVTVLHLGCGLDCRYMRMRKGPNVRWIDVDQPLVVEARARLVPRPPEDYALRTLQITKPGWARDIPNDRPTLVIAEGLFPFLPPEAGGRILRDVAEYFGGGGEIVVDHVSPLVVRLSGAIKFLRTSGSRFHWGVDDPRREIEVLHPKLRMKECLHWTDFMAEHPPIFGVVLTRMMGAFMPGWKSNLKLMRFEY